MSVIQQILEAKVASLEKEGGKVRDFVRSVDKHIPWPKWMKNWAAKHKASRESREMAEKIIPKHFGRDIVRDIFRKKK